MHHQICALLGYDHLLIRAFKGLCGACGKVPPPPPCAHLSIPGYDKVESTTRTRIICVMTICLTLDPNV
jgi:hypothetical protein